MTQTEELLLNNLLQSNQVLLESNRKFAEQLEALQDKVTELLAQNAWLKRQLFGRKSEKLAALDPNQLSLFTSEVCEEDNAQVDACYEQASNQIQVNDCKKPAKRQNRKLLEALPVVEEIIEPEGVDMDLYKRIGEERTRTLEFEPGKLYVKEIIRPKYALKNNIELPPDGGHGIIIAPLPCSPIYKSLAGSTMLAEILLQKYEYHVPFYRQIQQFRHLGIRISESTLSGWFKPVCELLEPLYEVLKMQALASDYIQVDETTVGVINKEKGKTDKEYLWMVRSVVDRLVLFHYDSGSRSGETIGKLLKSFKGYLQSDGYDAYNVFDDKEEVCLVACLAHMRRSFETAQSENKSLSEYALTEIQKLYNIERMANEQDMSDEERAALREKLATPILDSFEKWMEQTYQIVRPKSLVGKAIKYTYALWARMRNYLRDGRLKIDNNLAENAIRPFTISRKNFLFCGNHRAAENTAIICSLLATCKAQKVNPRLWLNDVIAKLPFYLEKNSGKDIKELLPNVWKMQNPNQTTTELQ